MSTILERIDSPEQLKKLSIAELEILAREIRQLIVETVSKTGGHLAPSLGTVELTIALHKVFNCPNDKIIWDVGHQAYGHKILTGRRERFGTLRQKGGITGFPKRCESMYDAFGVGHSSTSISAALGMALARDLDRKHNDVVAIIGDGSMTGGEAFEALNHAGDSGKHIIVVLNDNEMSIDKNVGALAEYMSKMRTAPSYTKVKKDLEFLLKCIPTIGDRVAKAVEHIRDGMRFFLIQGGIFEELGFTYLGPIDGHNIALLTEMMDKAKHLEGPVLLHVITKKGKGYIPAETEPDKFHGVGPFDIETGKVKKKTGIPPTYTAVFSKTLIELAEDNKDIVAITAAMPSGTGLNKFRDVYPDRFFDVGIAEQHAMTLAAGLACQGKRPVIALYSTFAQRAYDQIMHDVCLQNLPVVVALDRAGIVGEDGPTHHGVFDFSYLRHMPNITIMAPKDEAELKQMLKTALQLNGPSMVRYPRGCGLGVSLDNISAVLPVGRSEELKVGSDVTLIGIGTMVNECVKAAELLNAKGINAAVINARFVKPLDKMMLNKAAAAGYVVTVEENVLAGGFGSGILEYYADNMNQLPHILRLGLPDEFVEQGKRPELLEKYDLTAERIAERVIEFVTKNQE